MSEPQLRHLAAMEEGWSGLDALSRELSTKPQDEAFREKEARVGAMLRVATTDDGQALLEWLMDRTIRIASVPHVGAERLLIDPAKLASVVLWNEARKALVLELVREIERARAKAANARKTTED